jgi:hypothetical protein
VNKFLALLTLIGTALLAAPLTTRAMQHDPNFRQALPVHQSFTENFEAPLAPEVDLRPTIRKYELHIRNQGNRGTCTVFATTFLIEYQHVAMNEPEPHKLSEEYLNWAGNKATGEDQDGGFFTKYIGGFSKYAIAADKQMPYQPTFNPADPDTPNSAVIASAGRRFFPRYPFKILKVWDNQKGMTRAELGSAIETLRSGRPVATGIWWQTNFATVTVHGIPLLKDYPRGAETGSSPPMFDGHSIDLVGFREANDFPGGGYFIFRNSWGTSFGSHGYGFVSFQYLRTYANDAIAIAPMPWKRMLPTGRGSIMRHSST